MLGPIPRRPSSVRRHAHLDSPQRTGDDVSRLRESMRLRGTWKVTNRVTVVRVGKTIT